MTRCATYQLTATVAGGLFLGTLGAGVVASPRVAGTMPLSPHAVTLRVSVGGRSPILVKVLNGGMATIRLEGGATLGLTPVIGVPHRVVPYEVGLSAAGEPWTLRQGAPVALEAGVPEPLDWRGVDLDVTWVSVSPVSDAQFRHALSAVAERGGSTPDGPCSSCCVTCAGVLSCACSVQTPCGSCCCPEACDC